MKTTFLTFSKIEQIGMALLTGVIALAVVLNRLDHREMKIKDATILYLNEQLHPTRAKTFHETNMIPTVPSNPKSNQK